MLISTIRKFTTFLMLVFIWIGAAFLVAQGIPLVFKYFARHANEATVGFWMVVGGGVLAAGTLLLIVFKKH